jgi:hypothetical protein
MVFVEGARRQKLRARRDADDLSMAAIAPAMAVPC